MYIPVLVYYYASSNPLEGEAVQGETVEARQVSKATSNDGHAATSGFSAQLIDDLDTDNQFPFSPSNVPFLFHTAGKVNLTAKQDWLLTCVRLCERWRV